MFGKKKITGQSGANFRIYFVFAVIFLLYSLLLARFYYLQIILGEHYRVWAQGLEPYSRQAEIAQRGEIFFAGGEPLAINKDFDYAYASPINIKDKEAAASKLSEILNLDKKDLEQRLSGGSLYTPLKEKLTSDELQKINDAKIEGVYVNKKKMRYYPQGTVAAQLAGFVDDDGIGRYGLEEYYNEELSRGQDLILNIDYNIQYYAEQKLNAAVADLHAMSAEAIVADPKTGAIIAMAKSPNFDPNLYKDAARDNIEIFTNDSCQTFFEPGSVFKAITMASALNDGKVTPQTSYTDTGIVKIGGSTIYNYNFRSYGVQTMTNVLEHSVNTGVVFAEDKLGDAAFTGYVDKFGITEKTGIDLPEVASGNSEFKKGRAVGFATASFGQGIWMTSIQLIRAYSALANGGVLVQPSIAASGRKNYDENKKVRVIAEETSDTISTMLASVVDNGFGKKAKVSGYTIAGKTGTAQMSWSTIGVNQRGYSDKTTQSFIGYFPAPDPRFLILVKLKAPEANTAEYSAMPVFNDLAKYVIYVSQLPPNEKTSDAPPSTSAPATETVAH